MTLAVKSWGSQAFKLIRLDEISRKGGLSTATGSREGIQMRMEGPLTWDQEVPDLPGWEPFSGELAADTTLQQQEVG